MFHANLITDIANISLSQSHVGCLRDGLHSLSLLLEFVL
jgi:hypothetical protein